MEIEEKIEEYLTEAKVWDTFAKSYAKEIKKEVKKFAKDNDLTAAQEYSTLSGIIYELKAKGMKNF